MSNWDYFTISGTKIHVFREKFNEVTTRTFLFIAAFAYSSFRSEKHYGKQAEHVGLQDSTAKSYLALGDSYTIGESVEKGENFPNQLTAALRNKGINVNDPEIRAVTGWTTGNLISSLRNTPPQQKKYSLVTLLIGVNNQFQHRTLTEYKIEFNYLLNEAIGYAEDKKNVIVVSIPDYAATAFAADMDTKTISKEINAFNAAQKKITEEAGVKFINITAISRQGKKNEDLQAYDGLHPSALQYKKWVNLLSAPAVSILTK